VFYAAIEGMREPANHTKIRMYPSRTKSRPSENQEYPMKAWKVLLVAPPSFASVAAIAAYSVHTGPVAAAAPAGPPAMPVPVTAVVKRTIPVYLEYSARTESIREVSLQAKVAGYIQSQPAADGADVKGAELLYKIDERDYAPPSTGQGAGAAQRRGARVRSLELQPRRRTGQNWFPCQGQLRSARQHVGPKRGVGRDGQRCGPLRRDQSRLYEIRAPFSGRLGRNRAPVGTLVGGSGFTLNTLVQLDPLYVTFNPSERDLGVIQTARSAHKVVAKVFASRLRFGGLFGRAHLHRQRGRPDDGNDSPHGRPYPIRSSRFCRVNTSAYACMSATSRRASGASDRFGV